MSDLDLESIGDVAETPGRTQFPPLASAPRLGAVLLLVYPFDGRSHICLFRRTDTVARHRGEICLPGGSVEAGDADAVATALREAQEEVGVDPNVITIVGRLDTVYIPPTNFLIAPVVAVAGKRPDFQTDPVEVAELIEIPIDELRDPAVAQEESRLILGVQLRLPVYYWREFRVWGATARVLQQFLSRWESGRLTPDGLGLSSRH